MFVENTLIPRLAMGVRREVRDSREFAELRDRPGGAIVGRVPLFVPMYVYGEQRVGSQDWVLLVSAYAKDKAGASGWMPRSEVEVFSTRYGYVLGDTGQATEFFPTPEAAYAIVPEMGAEGEGSPSRSSSVLGQTDTTEWRPKRRTDQTPFMELGFDQKSGYPSTTPSLATRYDGRLVHVGAICGGPVDAAVLEKLREAADRNAAVQMLFVVDETSSMEKFFPGVANFIRNVGQAAGDGVVRRPRIAVSYYTDGPSGQRTTCESLREATPEVVTALADSVRRHVSRTPARSYANPPERMLDGMRDAIKIAQFTDGVTSIVVVIGDTGHEPEDPDKQNLLDEVAALITARGLMVFFVHVGLNGSAMNVAQSLFKEDADAVRQRVGQRNADLADRVTYTTADPSSLTAKLGELRREADRLAEQARLMADRITLRNIHTLPGPALVSAMTKDGVTLAKFNVAHQQLYLPSYAWVASPRDAERKGGSRARLIRYFCLAAEEQVALAALLESVSRDVDAGAAVDHDKAIQAFAQSLASATKDLTVVEAAHANWKNSGSNRTAGGFLERVLGLRVRSEVLFNRGVLGITEEADDARKSLQAMTALVRAAIRDKERFWFEDSSLASR
jgi:hypothetical protein